MITIVNYRERYQSDVEALDAEMAAEIARHADVCRDTICVALADGVFAGVGLIMETNPYRTSAEEELQYYRAEFRAVPGTEDEAEVSITLLEELQYRFGRLRGRDGRKPVLRLWVKAEDTAYTELLFDEGFRVGNVMTVMTRGIDDTDELLAGEEQAEPEDNRGPAYEPEPEPQYAADSAEFFRGDSDAEETEIREFYDSPEEWRAYFEVNARSFGQPDSENEMRFRLGNPDCRVWVAIRGDSLVAAMSVWPLGDGVYATENIFCDPEYQRRGITTKLLAYALGKLYDEGAVAVRLTVNGDNLPAIRLYRKFGYSVAYQLLEMHYFGKEDRAEV
ncbi:MAG: GNAT family N-acetyltransferase [Lachnospiraceae bacterium]|nr:GNAT family N-acetyltransferase [Lachnospiraceae bacterium]